MIWTFAKLSNVFEDFEEQQRWIFGGYDKLCKELCDMFYQGNRYMYTSEVKRLATNITSMYIEDETSEDNITIKNYKLNINQKN